MRINYENLHAIENLQRSSIYAHSDSFHILSIPRAIIEGVPFKFNIFHRCLMHFSNKLIKKAPIWRKLIS